MERKEQSISPLVSIIVPVHNTSLYLDECLTSLVNQTLKEIEIICVNDASTDCSLEILNAWAVKDTRIKIIDSKENIKAGGARNLGIKTAKAEYIGLVDSDDFVSPDMYKELIDHSLDLTADIVNSNLHVYHGSIDELHWNVPNMVDLSEDKLKKRIIAHSMRMVTGIFKRYLFDQYNLYYPEKVFYEDNAITTPLFCMAKRIILIDNINPFYYYRTTNVSSITRSAVSSEKLYDRVMAAKTMFNHTKRLHIYDNYKEELNFRFYMLFFRNTLFSYLLCYKPLKVTFIRQLYRDYRNIIEDTQISNNPYFVKRHTPIDYVFSIAGKNDIACFFLICLFKVKNYIKRKKKTDQ